MAPELEAQGERSAIVGRDAIHSLIITGDHNRVFTGDYEQLREAYLAPWSVFARVNLPQFVGRDWLVQEIDAFLRDHDRGYFIIEADAGLGKTAFLAWLTRERHYLHHFVELAPGPEGVGRGLKSLAAQVILAYQLSAYEAEGVLPVAATRSDYLYRLLQQAADQRLPGERIVLVIDALDEAGTPYNQNVLGLPQALPPGVFVIASQRPVSVTLTVDTASTPRRILPLKSDSTANLGDMRHFLERAVAWPEVAKALHTRGISPVQLIATLLDKCHGLWIYLHYIIHEIRRGERLPMDIDDLPDGITQYYARFWGHWRDADGPQWASTYLPLLATLAAVPEAVSGERLREWTGVTLDAQPMDRLLGEGWRPFLAVDAQGPYPRYRLYHATLREFCAGHVDRTPLTAAEALLVQELADATREAHHRIAGYYLTRWGGLDASLPGLHAQALLDETDLYGLQHLFLHLDYAGDQRTLHQLLRLEHVETEAVAVPRPGLRGRLNRLLGRQPTRTRTRHRPVWYAARSQATDVDAFLDDVTRAWRLAERAEDDGSESERRQTVGLQCRYALITASVKSLTTRIPPLLVVALIENEIWTPFQGFAYALQNPDTKQREELLLAIAPQLAAHGYPAEGFAAAKRISHAGRQAKALAQLAPRASPLLLAAFLERARLLMSLPPSDLIGLRTEVSRDLRPWYRATLRAEVLAGLAPYLPASLRPEAIVIGSGLEQPLDRVCALAALLPSLPNEERPSVLTAAVDAVYTIEEAGEQALAMLRLGPYLPEADKSAIVRTALSIARAAADTVVQDVLLEAVFPLLVQVDSPQAALATLQTISSESTRAKCLIDLIPRLPQAQLRDALALARQLKSPSRQAEVLTALAPHLPKPWLQDAVAGARTLPQHVPQLQALVGLAPYLPEAERGEILREIGAMLRSKLNNMLMINEVVKRRLLPQLAAIGGGTAALEIAKAITRHQDRVEAEVGLLSYLPQSGRVAALRALLDDAQTIGDADAQAVAMACCQVVGGAPQRALETILALGRYEREEPLAMLAYQLAAAGHFRDALAAIRELPESRMWDHPSQADTLARIARYLPEVHMREAMALVRAAQSQRARGQALAALVPYLAPEERAPTIAEALTAARELEDEAARALIWTAVAPYGSESVVCEIQAGVWALASESGQAKVLAALAPGLPESLRRETLSRARSITDPQARAEIFVAYAPYLPAAEQRDLLEEALREACTIKREDSQAEASAAVAVRLMEVIYPQALVEAVRASEWFRGNAQAAVIQRFAAAVADPRLREVFATAESWTKEHSWARALASVTAWLAEAGYPKEARTLAYSISARYVSERCSAFVAILPHLSAPTRLAVLKQVLKEVGGLQDMGERRRTLLALLPYVQALPAPDLKALWRTILHDLAACPREECLGALQVMVPILSRIGGPEALTETMQALTQVKWWFP